MKNTCLKFSKYTSLFFLSLFLNISIGLAQNDNEITQIEYLSGTDKDNRVEWEFKIDKGRKSGKWSKIHVPSNWELEGFGVYTYGHEWRDLLPESDAIGQYRHKFRVPSEWKSKVVEIVFEGVMTDAKVIINGEVAGPVHQGGFYRFKYDISDLLEFGQDNILEVQVNNTSANESINEAERDADFWAFAGIYRPVYLEVKPKEFIDRIAIDAKADGSFLVDVYGENIKNGSTIEAQILNMNNEPVGDIFQTTIKRGTNKSTLINRIETPKLWSPEFPNLYKVVVKLKNDGDIVHLHKEKFGFRTVELRPKDGFYLNGKKIKFKGVNRHSFWPTSGRTLSKDLSVKDVQLMKDMNMNAVRMSHYPPSQHFLEVTDSLGLFVIDELTGWQDAYDTKIGRKLVKELVIRDVNHPSIVIWANGNEGGNNYELLEEYPKYDPQNRTVIHPWNTLGETNTLHYPSYGYVTDVLSSRDEIYFPTEFLHGLYDGGHGAGLEDYWNLMKQSSLSAGGFLWVFADEGVVRTDQGGRIDVKDKETYAPDGIVGPFREKEGSFYTIKEIWSPVQINQKSITPEFDGKLKVENEYFFTDLNKLSFKWSLVNFPGPTEQQSDSTIVEVGTAEVPSIKPGLTGYLHINLPKNWSTNDALYLSATDPYGRKIMTWTWSISTPEQIAMSLVNTNNEGMAKAKEDDQNLYISANGVEVKISKENGLIVGIKNEITPISFNNGPKLSVENSQFKSLKHYRDGSDYVVTLEYEGPITEMRYTMMSNGWLKLDYSYLLRGEYAYMGVNFSYPEEKVKGVKWLGEGPFRVWKNRMKGPQFAVYEKLYNNTITGSDWSYPEFKGYHDRMFWAVIDNDEYPITIVSGTDDVFLRLFTPKPSNNENTNPKFPEGNISFMDAISPIGTKFKEPGQLGPQSQKTEFHHRNDRQRIWGATLFFDFGAGVRVEQ